nr:PQQ-binding-like beta-propeller repeat protein [bacterium]
MRFSSTMNLAYLIAPEALFVHCSIARTFVLSLMVSIGLSSANEEDPVDPLTVNDWPQYLGPQRDTIWREEGVALEFSKHQPKLLWSAPLGSGYSGPAVANGRVYVMDRQAKPYKPKDLKPGTNLNFVRATIPGTERIVCLDEESGKLLWSDIYEANYTSVFPYAIGPRTTPLVDDGMVYTLGAEGALHAYDAEHGILIWTKNLISEYKFETPLWGTSAHPLIDGELLICIVGGENSTVVAFDKKTGEEKWKALNARSPGYSTPVIETVNGHRQLLVWDAENVNGLDPKTGEVFWSVEFKPEYGMAVGAPRVWKDLVYVMGFNGKSAAIRVDSEGRSAKVAWGRDLRKGVAGVMNTAYVRDGFVYSGGRKGLFRCIEIETGRRVWAAEEPLRKADGSGRGPWLQAFTVHHEPSGRTLIFNDHGEMIVAELSPKKYHEVSRMSIIDPTHTVSGRLLVWSHPALANKRLYCRNDKEIRCWDLSGGE